MMNIAKLLARLFRRVSGALNFLTPALISEVERRKAASLIYDSIAVSSPVYVKDVKLEDWIFERLPKVAYNGRALVVGCGAGRELVALGRMGFYVVGVDLSPKMASVSRSALSTEGIGGEIIEGDICLLDFPKGSFSVVTCSAAFLSLVCGRQRRKDLLLKFKEWIKDDGRLFLEALYSPDDVSPSVAAGISRKLLSLLPGGRREVEDGDVIVASTGEFIHIFRRGDIEREVTEAGLDVEWMDYGDPPLNRVRLVAGKDQ